MVPVSRMVVAIVVVVVWLARTMSRVMWPMTRMVARVIRIGIIRVVRMVWIRMIRIVRSYIPRVVNIPV
jgi:hypothetical protein